MTLMHDMVLPLHNAVVINFFLIMNLYESRRNTLIWALPPFKLVMSKLMFPRKLAKLLRHSVLCLHSSFTIATSPNSVRMQFLIKSLVLPVVFYGAGSWPLLAARTFAKLFSAITNRQKQIISDGFWKEQQSTDRDLRA